MKRVNAMMTIEAVIILPLCLMISMLIIWTGIFLYNKTAADYALSVAVIQAARQAEADNDTIVGLAKDKAVDLLNARMVMMEEASVEVKVDLLTVEAEYSGRMRAPVLPAFGDVPCFDWSIVINRQTPRLKEAMTVRTMKNIAGG